MVRIIEEIERDYDEARAAGRLSESGAMSLLDSEELLLISKGALQRMEARIEAAEREAGEWKLEASFAWMKAQGYTADMFLSPEDLEDRASRIKTKRKFAGFAPFEVLGSLFAKKTKQVG